MCCFAARVSATDNDYVVITTHEKDRNLKYRAQLPGLADNSKNRRPEAKQTFDAASPGLLQLNVGAHSAGKHAS